jgi:hypothetical protein
MKNNHVSIDDINAHRIAQGIPLFDDNATMPAVGKDILKGYKVMLDNNKLRLEDSYYMHASIYIYSIYYVILY